MGLEFRRMLAAVIVLVAASGCSDSSVDTGSGPLRAAVCAKVITPVVGENHSDPIYMAGFNNDFAATGVHDDLWARGVVLESGDRKIAIVSLDLVGYFNNEVQTIRELVDDPSFDLIVISSTHNHEGPDTMGLWGPDELTSGTDLGYLDFVNATTAECIREANENLAPAEIRFATGDTNGLSLPPEPDLVADSVILQHLCVGGFFDAEGACIDGIEVEGDPGPIRNSTTPSFQLRRSDDQETIATVVNYASHHEALGADNSLITSDFPHYMREALEARFGGVAIYVSADVGVLQGPLDIFLENEDGELIERRTFAFAERMGELLATAAGDALEAVDQWSDDPEIEYVQSGAIDLVVTNPYFDLLGALGVFGRRPVVPLPEGGLEINTEMQAFRIGPAQFAVVPNETDPQIANTYRDQMNGAEHRFLIGMGNDEVGYQMPEAKYNPGCFLCFQVNIGGDDSEGLCPGEEWNDCGTVFINNIGPQVDPKLQEIMNGLLTELNS